MASTTLPSGNPHSSAPQGGFEHSNQQVRETWKKTRKGRGWNGALCGSCSLYWRLTCLNSGTSCLEDDLINILEMMDIEIVSRLGWSIGNFKFRSR
jgi:hypothetical protein